MRRLKLPLPLAALISLLAVGSAAAQTIPTTVTLRFLPNPYGELMSGKVSSGEPGCKKNRTVTLYRARPGPDKLYSSRKTNARGRYRFAPKGQPSFPDGKYYARAPRKVLQRGTANERTCGGAITGKVRPVGATPA